MIYANFFYFIVAITLFSAAPASLTADTRPLQNLLWMMIVLLGFWVFNRNRFEGLRRLLDEESPDRSRLTREYRQMTALHTILALGLFALEVLGFNLKALLARLPLVGASEFLLHALGLAVFILHLVMIWYWSYVYLNETLNLAPSPRRHITAHIRFNLVILIPWLAISLVTDGLALLDIALVERWMRSALFQVLFFALFLILLLVFAPLLIVRLWDCRPLEDRELKTSIIDVAGRLGVRFRGIMSWNALNRGLLTAGVVGLFRPVRYLLITPRLLNLLEEDEILAVVSHEVGHVKKRHLFFYLLLFLGFIVITMGLLSRLVSLTLTTSFGFNALFRADGTVNTMLVSMVSIALMLLIFIVYFRFIFGFFMRHFERQADLYCFSSGIDPSAMISSFRKLASITGDQGKRRNWHHFNLQQRIGMIQRAMEDPGLIQKHNRKVRRGLFIYLAGILAFTLLAFNPLADRLDQQLDAGLWIKVVEKQLEENPRDPRLHRILADLYQEIGRWTDARSAYQRSLELDPAQAETLNNYAWLLLTAGEPSVKDPVRALELARRAAGMARAAHIFDTLAEALYQNRLYEAAVRAAAQALQLARDNPAYYRGQLDKMKQALRLDRKSISL